MLNQNKIGIFIAERRKALGMTQKQLAETLCISDKAVSKWETGRSMPDNTILLELCKVLDINVNELLSGEKLSDDSYHGKAEENMMTLMKEKQNESRINAVIGLVLGILFLIWCAQMVSGNVSWYLDIPSLILDMALIWILLFMSGLTKDFFRGFSVFFGKAKEVEEEAWKRMLAAYKLVLIALPVSGLIMTVMAVIGVLANVFVKVIDMTSLGPNMAVACLTLLYSLIIEALLLPVAARLWTMRK